MKKILFILLLTIPLIGFGQLGKYTNHGERGLYADCYTFPYQAAKHADGADAVINRASIGYKFTTSIRHNTRLNLGVDYFSYGIVGDTGINIVDPSAISWMPSIMFSRNATRHSYVRITNGIGMPLYIGRMSTATLNLNATEYLGRDPAIGLDINLTYDFMLFTQFTLGYSIIQPSLSSSLKYKNTESVYHNEIVEYQQEKIRFPRFYFTISGTFIIPTLRGESYFKRKRTSTTTRAGLNYMKPTIGCIKGNCKNGKGVYLERDGQKYKGRFKNGKPHKKGTMFWADGSTYKGQWKNGKMHGEGVFVSAVGEELAGDWVDDEFADPKLKPELIIKNIIFKDSDGDEEIYAEENGVVNFEIHNIGLGTAYNITFNINDHNNINGLEFKGKIKINKLKKGDKQKISIPIRSTLNLETGKANFNITIDELNGFPPDNFFINFKTLAYINPQLKITSYKFSPEKGKNKLMVNDRGDLSFVVQNIGQGKAEDIVIDIEFLSSNNIFSASEKRILIKSLSANEHQTINFEFFTNKNFEDNSIDISIDIMEKYKKYGDKEILSQEIGKEIQSAQIINYDGGKERENVIINEVSLFSLVDKNIPTNKKVNNRFALVIGNEDYKSKQSTLSSEQNVDYAVNDATIFKQYCLKTLGVKEDNMFSLINATAGEMSQEIDLISKIIKKLGDKAELIVYYAGHGYPDELTKVPYLIPVDVSASNLSSGGIQLDDFYQKLESTNASKITIFLDACFTGGGRNSGLVASRGVRVKPKEGILNGNIVVFSASSAEQSSLPYHDEGHGIFTYFLLKKFQETKGNVTLGELSQYLDENVSIKSLRVNKKEQDPTVNTSSKVANDWRNWKF